MKVLTATARTQGQRANDFNWCIEGELVTLGQVCSADRGRPDGRCGCGRSFAGLASHRGTTTAMVRDLDLSRSDYVEVLRASLADQGWDPSAADAEADWLLRLVDDIPVGTVLERRLDWLVFRPAGGFRAVPG